MKSKENNAQKKYGFLKGKIHQGIDKGVELLNSFFLYIRHKCIDFIVFLVQAREKSRDLAGTNLALAKMHFQNKNLFDAKIRYMIVIKLDKQNFEAYFGLAYIYYVELKLPQALENFKKASEFCQDPEKKAEIDGIISSIESHLKRNV